MHTSPDQEVNRPGESGVRCQPAFHWRRPRLTRRCRSGCSPWMGRSRWRA